ncbi:hypothetical protein D3C77_655160 [compost metagenome]
MHIVVSGACGFAATLQHGVLGFVEGFTRALERGHGAFTQFVGLVARGAGCFAQQVFGVVKAGLDTVDEFFFCDFFGFSRGHFIELLLCVYDENIIPAALPAARRA